MRYSDEVLDRVRHLRRVGVLPPDATDVGTGETGTLDTGTVVRIQVRVTGGRVAEAVFKVFGCSAAIASASLVTERLEGAAVETGLPLMASEIVSALDLPDERAHVAGLAVEAARRAMDDWRTKQEQITKNEERRRVGRNFSSGA